MLLQREIKHKLAEQKQQMMSMIRQELNITNDATKSVDARQNTNRHETFPKRDSQANSHHMLRRELPNTPIAPRYELRSVQ